MSTQQPQGLRNIGNTCFLNAVLQALAACPTVLEYLDRSLQAHPEVEAPLADAVSMCLASTAPQAASPRQTRISPVQVLKAFREYIPADCLRDGEQNDSAEVLELLCSTLTTELAQHTAESLSQQAQLSWQTLSSLQHVTGSAPHRSPLDLGQQASDASSSHHQPNAADNAQLQANGADAVLHPAQQTVSEGDLLLNMSKAHDSIQSWLGQAEVHRMPLQGNVVGDMSCLKCQHSFESQHTPFLLLPLALPTAQATNKFSNGMKLSRTAVAPRTTLQQCLQSFCGMELLQGVHCPRCTLQSVLTATPTADTATQLSDKASPTNSSAANDKRLRSRPSQTNQLLNDHANADKQTDASSSSHTCCSPATATTSAVSSDTLHASHDYKPVLNGQSSAATSHGGSPSEQTLSREHPSSAIPANLHNNCQEQSQGLTPCSGDLGAQADADSNTKSLSAPAVAQDSSPSDRVHLLAEAKANSSEVTDEQQLWHRGIVEALLRSSQQWPALDYEVLANKAGLTWQPVGSSCVKRISLGQPPNVLCLHLRRAFWTNQGTHVKLSGHVDFTLQLDITPYSAASRGILNSMAQQYVPSPVQASWIGTVSDQAAQDLDAQNSVKRPAAGKLHTEQQPQCDQDDVAVSVALSVEATGHVKLVLRLLTDRSSPVTGPLSSKGDMSGGMPEMQVLPSPAAKIQLKKQGLEQPAGAIPQEGSVSHSYQSPFASHQMPFSPQAKPTLALASHALSFAASSRLDGSDDEAEVQEATSAPDQSNTEVNRHSLGSNRAYSAQLHGQTLEGRQSDFDEQQHQTSTTGQRSHSGHAQPQLYKADSERCDQVENASVPHRSSGNVRHDHDVGYEVTPRHTSAVEAFLNRSKAYDLTAAVVHHGGGSSSGHYTVYRRVLCQSGEQQTNFAPGLPQWFSISDEHVQHVSVQEVLDCEATLLFYAQI